MNQNLPQTKSRFNFSVLTYMYQGRIQRFWGKALVSKITHFSVTRNSNPPKIFRLTTSIFLEKALKAPPSHFKLDKTFGFFAYFWGALEFGRLYRIRDIKIPLDTSLYIYNE